eukprot:scaffold14925_cov97-Isochrysis_galbana.AAC.4
MLLVVMRACSADAKSSAAAASRRRSRNLGHALNLADWETHVGSAGALAQQDRAAAPVDATRHQLVGRSARRKRASALDELAAWLGAYGQKEGLVLQVVGEHGGLPARQRQPAQHALLGVHLHLALLHGGEELRQPRARRRPLDVFSCRVHLVGLLKLNHLQLQPVELLLGRRAGALELESQLARARAPRATTRP